MKTTPFPHQQELFDRTKDHPEYALFWEMGCGKSKAFIMTQDYLANNQSVNGALIVAPNGVQLNWVTDELPTHCDIPYTAYCYWSKTAKGKREESKQEALFKADFPILCMPYNAFLTEHGKDLARRFMKKRSVLLGLDESQRIKTPGAKTTKTILAAAKLAKVRRGMSGTPITQGPFDVYSQIRALREDYWKGKRLSPFSVFKAHFGRYMTPAELIAKQGYVPKYPVLAEYQHLEELQEIIRDIGHRLTKESAGINLPPRVFKNVYFDLTPAQARCYNQLAEELQFELPDTDEIVEAPDAIVRLMRFQQITSGFVTVETGEPVQRIDGKNPRLDALLETLEDCPGKSIIWAKFTREIDDIMGALGPAAVRYDGQVSHEDRARAKLAFQQGDARYFVAKPQSGATGLTLTAASYVHYFSNSYNAEHRQQSADRPYRIGQTKSLTYFDYCANGTVDLDIARNLKKKSKIAKFLLGDTENA